MNYKDIIEELKKTKANLNANNFECQKKIKANTKLINNNDSRIDYYNKSLSEANSQIILLDEYYKKLARKRNISIISFIALAIATFLLTSGISSIIPSFLLVSILYFASNMKYSHAKSKGYDKLRKEIDNISAYITKLGNENSKIKENNLTLQNNILVNNEKICIICKYIDSFVKRNEELYVEMEKYYSTTDVDNIDKAKELIIRK